MIEERRGDIFGTAAGAIGHGVNVDGRMGAGIARQIRARHPGMYALYAEECRRGLLAPGHTMAWRSAAGAWVYNIASQDRPGPRARLGWLAGGVEEALLHAEAEGVARIALPRIGCGIGGLDWADVLPALDALAAAHPAVLVEVWTYR